MRYLLDGGIDGCRWVEGVTDLNKNEGVMRRTVEARLAH